MKPISSWCAACVLVGALGCSEADATSPPGGGGAPEGSGGAVQSGGAGGATGGNASQDGSASGGVAGSGGGGMGGSGVGGAGARPVVGTCNVFSADDEWNRDVSQDSADPEWTQNLLDMVGDISLHPDLGNYEEEHYGIPINVVPANQPLVPVSLDWYESESDPGPYPFPPPDQALIEGGTPYACDGDCHLIVVQESTCMLYEGYACSYSDQWHCGCGARWDLSKNSYGQRPAGWTSADAAGLAILPGLLRYDEVASGAVRHAIRFTTHCSRSKYVRPATHYAVPDGCPDDAAHPPMGLRVRLRQDFDVSGFGATARVILTAFKQYGMILADNGSDFYFQGERHEGWNEELDELKAVPVSAFEVVAPPPLEP